MSTHNIGIYEEISKIITQLSPNTHLISSAVCRTFTVGSAHLRHETGSVGCQLFEIFFLGQLGSLLIHLQMENKMIMNPEDQWSCRRSPSWPSKAQNLDNIW